MRQVLLLARQPPYDEGNLSDNRRRDVLDSLSFTDLRLTEKMQRAIGKCLAYFDHFNNGGAR